MPLKSSFVLLFSTTIIFILNTQPAELLVLEAPIRTALEGRWGDWDECPPEQYVSGLQLKMNIGLTGIKLYCTFPGRSFGSHFLHSLVGRQGNWLERLNCPDIQFATGFQLKFNPGTGSNSFSLVCPNDTSLLYSHHNASGREQWGDRKMCPTDHVLCGMRTYVEDPVRHRSRKHYGSTVNNVHLKCCEIVPNCNVSLGEEAVLRYDNLEAMTAHNESYSITEGFTTTQTTTVSAAHTSRTTHGFTLGINGQISTGGILKFIGLKLKAGLGVGYTYSKEGMETSSWSNTQVLSVGVSRTHSRNITVPAGVMITIWQPVIYCDQFVVRQFHGHVRRVDTTKVDPCLAQLNKTTEEFGKLQEEKGFCEAQLLEAKKCSSPELEWEMVESGNCQDSVQEKNSRIQELEREKRILYDMIALLREKTNNGLDV